MVEGVTNEEIMSWKKDLNNGLKINDISKKYNRAWNVVQRTLENEDKRKFRKLTTKEREIIKNDFKKGLNPYEIAKKRKYSIGIIYWTIKKVAEIKRKNYIQKYQEKINQLSDFELGYICASIDGDGCIFVSKEKYRYRINLTITNRNKKIVNYFYKLMGLDININSFRKKKKTNLIKERGNFGKIYNWRLTDKKLLSILFKRIYPLIIGKKEEIFCALKLIETKDINEKRKYFLRLKKFKAKYNNKVKLS